MTEPMIPTLKLSGPQSSGLSLKQYPNRQFLVRAFYTGVCMNLLLETLLLLVWVTVWLIYVPTVCVLSEALRLIGISCVAEWAWTNPIGRWMLNEREE